MKIDLNYFPGYTRKSICFTIDDGYVPLDRKFLEIVTPAGIRGTFNLCGHSLTYLTPEEYREFYKGNGISNHCYAHPYALDPEAHYNFTDEPYNPETADPAKVYRSPRGEGFYMIHYANGFREAADRAHYLECIDRGMSELEAVFGKGNIHGYVWPYYEQKDPEITAYIHRMGYESVRKTGDLLDSTGFSLPADRMRWSYNATWQNMLDCAEKYAALPDDGKLHFFCFGVHSNDFEASGRWDVLTTFCDTYGNRPEDFFSAPVETVFAYEDAIASVKEKGGILTNPSSLDLYLTVDGKKAVLPAKSALNANNI